jgi:hypothetical protein
MPVMALLFLPIALGASQLYHHWWHLDEAVGDETLAGKRPYLNPVFWYVRAVIYLGFWVWLATWFRKRSLEQDQTGDPMISLQLSKRAAPGLVLLGLTYTFAVFDWIMSLNPHWFSTIYAVIFFGGTMMATYGTLALTAMWLSNRGWLKDVITAEHYHDLGKLLFAFMVFWSYTSFSQYMLQWYATLPEETEYWKMRLLGQLGDGGHRADRRPLRVPVRVPDVAARQAQPQDAGVRRVPAARDALAGPALHGRAELPRERLPAGSRTGTTSRSGIGFVAILASFALGNLRKVPLVPERDPRLPESLHFTNI